MTDENKNEEAKKGSDEQSSDGSPAKADDAVESDEISLEDIDAILADTDPEFEVQMKDIEENVRSVEAQVAEEDRQEQHRKKSFQNRFPKIYRKIEPLLRSGQPLVKLFKDIVVVLQKMVAMRRELANWVQQNIKSIKVKTPALLLAVKEQVYKVINAVKIVVKSLYGLDRKQKLLSIVLIVMLGGSIYIGLKTFKGGIWIPFLQVRPQTTFQGVADFEILLKEPIAYDPYYEAFPQPEYTWLLKHVVVSLKRRVSDANPMGAFEFFFSLDSKETAVEVKDREPQVLDRVQRVIEEFSYEELNTARGLDRMKGLVKSEVNEMLNYGRIKEVLINTKVLKP